MINDTVVARQVLEVALRVCGELDQSVHLVLDGSIADAEVTDYKGAVGHVMAVIYDRLLTPLFRMHPQLVPDEWSTWSPSSGGV